MAGSGDRLLRVLGLLGSRPWSTAEELADRLGVTTRTIRRDVADLRALGYPIDATGGPGGGYGFGRGGRLPPLLLDEEEAIAVAIGLRLVGQTSVTGGEDAAARASAILERLLSPTAAARVEAVSTSTLVLDRPREAVDAGLVARLAEAVRDGVRVHLRYTDARGTASDRRVDPHRLVHVRGRWYLMAHDPEREDWRTFRLDRIAEARATGQRTSAPAAPDALAFVARAVTTAPYRVHARVHVHAPAEEVLARVPPDAGTVELLADGCLLETGADDLDWMVGHLVVLGLPFTVLDPPALRERVAAAAARLDGAAGPR